MEPKEMDSKTQNEVNSVSEAENTVENAPGVAADNAPAETSKDGSVSDSETKKNALEKQEVADAITETQEETVDVKAEDAVDSAPEMEDSAASEEAEAFVETPAEEAETVEVVSEEKTDAVLEEAKEEGAAEPAKSEVETEKVEDASKETAPEEAVKPVEPEIEYSKLGQVELINAFRNIIDSSDFARMSSSVDAIKLNFYKSLKAEQAEQKKLFIEAGGVEEEFKPEENVYEKDLKDLLKQFRHKKFELTKDIEAQKDKNLEIKYQIIEDIKSLINGEESINKTFQDFRELQQKWREIGPVPQASMKNLWETYHHHVENFYDYIKINKELRDLDLKKNLELKVVICEKAEELLMEPSVLKAFNTLQKFHEQWREIGPVPRENKEEIWERFKAATRQINKKHQDFFESRKKAQKKNLEAKVALCEKAEEFLTLSLSNPKEWEDKSKELVEIQKYWRTIGFAPKKENNEIYERFRVACDSFFNLKREFYAKHKEEQNNNLQLKIDLCVQAEALKESTDWKKTTEEFISIQKKWKEIGPVPRKHSDSIWKRFRSACDSFFENKSNFFSQADEEQVKNLELKKALIEKVETFKPTGDDDKDFNTLRDFQREWMEIGHVPIKEKNEVQKKFRDSINSQFDKLRIEDKERNLLRFKNKAAEWQESDRGRNRMNNERDKYVIKLKQLESDLIILKNNIGFFANSKNAEGLIADVKRKIERNEEQIEYIKDKIRIIDEAE